MLALKNWIQTLFAKACYWIFLPAFADSIFWWCQASKVLQRAKKDFFLCLNVALLTSVHSTPFRSKECTVDSILSEDNIFANNICTDTASGASFCMQENISLSPIFAFDIHWLWIFTHQSLDKFVNKSLIFLFSLFNHCCLTFWMFGHFFGSLKVNVFDCVADRGCWAGAGWLTIVFPPNTAATFLIDTGQRMGSYKYTREGWQPLPLAGQLTVQQPAILPAPTRPRTCLPAALAPHYNARVLYFARLSFPSLA